MTWAHPVPAGRYKRIPFHVRHPPPSESPSRGCSSRQSTLLRFSLSPVIVEALTENSALGVPVAGPQRLTTRPCRLQRHSAPQRRGITNDSDGQVRAGRPRRHQGSSSSTTTEQTIHFALPTSTATRKLHCAEDCSSHQMPSPTEERCRFGVRCQKGALTTTVADCNPRHARGWAPGGGCDHAGLPALRGHRLLRRIRDTTSPHQHL